MRIIDLKEFLKMPDGTVFMKYEPCCFETLCIKGDNVGERDFIFSMVTEEIDSHDSGDFAAKLFESQETGSSVKMDFDCYMRDGCFNDNQLFAVYEKDDIEGLVFALLSALRRGY